MMITKIRRWGNSLGLRIPKSVAEDVHVAEGTPVLLKVQKGCLVVTPVKKKEYVLEDLLAQIKSSNLHEEVDSGTAVGREAW